ncbi:sterol regulatory element-binding protein cleavage-activating protein [Nilaparvata lugens]|uniref:sterol regulatory element-binding protein cleavage-activating protein n=1 Tax=Nilaparvata lugens TaxID=108931 RepID=UPI00193CEC24|nr:sterol regulatory element-binding protein cleavage-activating protein [Nilaparvata lugens]
MANPRWTETSVPRSLPERVAQLYYAHGLFCATHPYIVIFLALSLTLLCCYPLLSLPLPGNVPQQYASHGNQTLTDAPRWLQASSPVCYVQQVVMKAAVSPWSDDFLLTDAYRAPLAEVFSLVEVIQNYQHENSSLTLSDVCFHVESARSKKDRLLLPEYGCLLLSPANFWRQDLHRFTGDTNLISTIYSYQNFQKGKVSLSEMLFGLNMKDTGIKRYPLRKRQRIIQFAVTIVFRHYDKQFIDGLHDRLARLYPLHQKSDQGGSGSGNSSDDDPNQDGSDGGGGSLHIYYPGEFDYAELAPLSGIYALLFAYVYFFLRKIELVRSKVGIALSAVMTVVSSLLVTLGICFFFGLELAGCGRGTEGILLQMFPYLVVTVGFENVIVLTKSVVTTAPHLDVKIRIAQGLSREGWSITKTLLIEVTIFTVGLLTLVPDIQEFCIFAIVGSLVDFFLQIFLYTTILGLDIRQQADSPVEPTSYSSLQLRYNSTSTSPLNGHTGMSRSRSHPRLNSHSSTGASGGVGGGSAGGGGDAVGAKIPKRLKLANFWARTRFVQHAFMVCMCMWIGGILYNAGMLHTFTTGAEGGGGQDIGKPLGVTPATRDPRVSRFKPTIPEDPEHRATILEMEKKFLASQKHSYKQLKDDSDLAQLKPSGWEPWQRVSPHHWSAVLALHNSSHLHHVASSPTYVTLLPAIRLATVVTPQRAQHLRNPFEKQLPPLQWQSLALALDPLDSLTGAGPAQMPSKTSPSPLLPSSPMELFLAMLLCLTSIMVVSYTVLVLYRCICSRNYAEWRSSWSPSEGVGEEGAGTEDVVLEAVPLVLSDSSGPQQQVECVASDGIGLVVSVCLAGEVRCWDAATGELLQTVRRTNHFRGGHADDLEEEAEAECARNQNMESDDDHLYQELAAVTMSHHNHNSSSMVVRNRHHKAHHWDLPDLTSTINTNFTAFTHNQTNYGSNFSEAGLVRSTSVGSNYSESDLVRSTSVGSNYSDGGGGSGEAGTSSVEDRTLSAGDQTINDKRGVGGKSEVVGASRRGFDFGPLVRSAYEDFERDRERRKEVGGDECKCGAKAKCGRRTLGGRSGVKVMGGKSEVRRGKEEEELENSPIWCIDCQDSLVVVGCADGRMEFWCANTGQLKFVSDASEGAGLTCVKLVAMGSSNHVVAARLNGSLDIYSLAWRRGAHTTLHRRTHIRTGSADSPLDWTGAGVLAGGGVGGAVDGTSGGEESQLFSVARTSSTRAHQQPITVLDVEGGRVLTGSQDHTLKVMSLLDQVIVYTLHGHCGPITALFIDAITPSTAGSASQDGMLCVWDLLTGACMYSLQAHDGCVTALTYSVSYIISLGADERLCVWERFQGHLLNTIQVSQTYCTSMVMLTHNLLITSKQGSLVVWDVRSGEPVRIVKLGYADNCLFVQHLVPLRMRNSVVCDYGSQLRIVRFPLV